MKQVVKTVIRDFHTKVVGVTYGNVDGSSRQAYIKSLKPNQELILRPVPTTEYPDAIGVFTLDGKQLGHVSAGIAAELKNDYPTNHMQVTVANVTGGNDMNYGCNIHIIIYGEVSGQTEPQPIDQTVQTKRKTWLWVLGWVFIFPLPLTLILAKKPNMKKGLKYGIIIAAWIVYAIIAISGTVSKNNEPKPVNQIDAKETTVVTEAATIPATEKETEVPTEAEPTEPPTEASTKAPTEAPTPITFYEYTDNVLAGSNAFVTIQGEPNTDYSIHVYYDSGESKAAGLERKTSDDNGYVTWEWEVGTNTAKGEHSITIVGGGSSARTTFNVN